MCPDLGTERDLWHTPRPQANGLIPGCVVLGTRLVQHKSPVGCAAQLMRQDEMLFGEMQPWFAKDLVVTSGGELADATGDCPCAAQLMCGATDATGRTC